MTVKKILTVILGCTPCLLLAQKGGPFAIKADFGPDPVHKVIFVRYTLKTGQHIDTLKPVDGKLIIKEVMNNERQKGQFVTYGEKNTQSVSFYLEPGTITVDYQPGNRYFKLGGTPLNRDLNQFNNVFGRLVDSMSAGRPADANFQFSKEVQAAKLPVIKQFILQHPASPVGLDILAEYAIRSKDADRVQAAFDELSPALRQSETGQEVTDRIKGMRAVGVGDQAPAFTIANTEGKPVSLSDFKGKYVLVDFWATWCGPCIAEMPNLIKAYSQYRGKNFEIIGISLDRPDSKELWLKRIREYKMDWTQVSELKWWNGKSALLYNVNSVPANFLVDPQGKIVATNLRGEALVKKLAEIL